MSVAARWIVVTGGPFSGKTSLVERFGARGYRTLPEAALPILQELNTELGVEGQKAWRWSHPVEFQELVARRQQELEAGMHLGPGELLFSDRGLPDSLAYCRYKGVAPPDWLLAATRGRPYERVLVLDTLTAFDRRVESGRSSTHEDSLRIRDHLLAVYRELGHAVHLVPELPPGERDAHVAQLLDLSI